MSTEALKNYSGGKKNLAIGEGSGGRGKRLREDHGKYNQSTLKV